MQCLHPIVIKNRRYDGADGSVLRFYANEYFAGGRIQKGYPDDYYVQVPCGYCKYCLKRQRREWIFRALNEFKDIPPKPLNNSDKSLFFITLTFEDKYLNDESFDPRNAIRKFLDVLRKRYCNNRRIRHFIIGEFGTSNTKRLHYHGLLWNLSYKQIPFSDFWKLWTYGRCDIQYVRNPKASIVYLTKYLLKYDSPTDRALCRIMVSHGFGLSYTKTEDYKQRKQMDSFFSVFFARPYPLSRYYTSRMYDVFDKIRQYTLRLQQPIQPFRLGNFETFDINKYRVEYFRQVSEELSANPSFNKKYGSFFSTTAR